MIAVRTDDLQDKAAVLASGSTGVFTIPHFDNYAAILIDLSTADPDQVRELIIDAWLATAPPALTTDYLAR